MSVAEVASQPDPQPPFRRPRLRPAWCDLFLESMRATNNVALSCERAGIARPYVYQYALTHTSFALEWAEAQEAFCVVYRAKRRRITRGDFG